MIDPSLALFRFLEFVVPPRCECEGCTREPTRAIATMIGTEVEYVLWVCDPCYPVATQTIHEAMIAAGGVEVSLPAANGDQN